MSAPNEFDLEATIRALRCDLAAAQEALVEERNVSAWLSSDVTRLGQKLQEAQEARERAEERLANERAVVEKLREDYERAGAKPRFMALMKLIRETQDVNVRAQRAEALAESLKADAALGQILLRYIDRLNDPTYDDPTTRIVGEMMVDVLAAIARGERMTPAEEDALIKECCPFEGFAPKWADIRLTIRAAVAQERERCAKVCERYAGEHFEERADECAAAIRRGE